MKTMNYIIKLPDEKIQKEPGNSMTLYDMFQEDMQLILTRLDKREMVEKLFKLKRPDRISIRDRILQKHDFFPTSNELMEIIDSHVLQYRSESEPTGIRQRRVSLDPGNARLTDKEEQEYK